MINKKSEVHQILYNTILASSTLKVLILVFIAILEVVAHKGLKRSTSSIRKKIFRVTFTGKEISNISV